MRKLRVHQRRKACTDGFKNNLASLRVLRKCGFKVFGEDKEFSKARGEEVEEFVLTLEADEGRSSP